MKKTDYVPREAFLELLDYIIMDCRNIAIAEKLRKLKEELK